MSNKRQDDIDDLGLIKHQQTLQPLRNRSIDETKKRRSSLTQEGQSKKGRKSPSKQKKLKSGVARNNTAPTRIMREDDLSSQDLDSDGNDDNQLAQQSEAKHVSKPKGRKKQITISFLDTFKEKVSSTFSRENTPYGKASSMKRELDNLNLSASKEYAFLYENQKLREHPAMRDPDQYWLRDGSMKERPGGGRKRKRGDTNCCSDFLEMINQISSSSGLIPLIMVGLLLLGYLLIFRPVPYCDNAMTGLKTHCSYDGFYLPWDCRPCPTNAHCINGQMICMSNYQNVEGEVCLTQDDNPYIAKLVGFLLRLDKGIRWNKNFKHFGAAHPQKMTGEELLTQLGAKSELERANAGAAILTVLRQSDRDLFCVAEKFIAQNLENFVDWSDIAIISLKLGWPQKHN